MLIWSLFAFASSPEISVKKQAVAGICETLSEEKIYDCQINVGESLVFESVSTSCPAGFAFQLKSKDRQTYLISPPQSPTPGNERVELIVKKLLSAPAEQRATFYSDLRSICETKVKNRSGNPNAVQ